MRYARASQLVALCYSCVHEHDTQGASVCVRASFTEERKPAAAAAVVQRVQCLDVSAASLSCGTKPYCRYSHTHTQRCINTCVHIAVLTLSMLIFLWDTFPYTDASCFPCMLLYYAKVNSGCKAPFFNSRSNSHPEDLTVVIIGCGNVLFTNQMFLSLQHVCPFAFRTHFHTEFP